MKYPPKCHHEFAELKGLFIETFRQKHAKIRAHKRSHIRCLTCCHSDRMCRPLNGVVLHLLASDQAAPSEILFVVFAFLWSQFLCLFAYRVPRMFGCIDCPKRYCGIPCMPGSNMGSIGMLLSCPKLGPSLPRRDPRRPCLTERGIMGDR